MKTKLNPFELIESTKAFLASNPLEKSRREYAAKRIADLKEEIRK